MKIFRVLVLLLVGLSTACAESGRMTVYETLLHRLGSEPVPETLFVMEDDAYVPFVDLAIVKDLYPEKGFRFEENPQTCETDEGFFLFDPDTNTVTQHLFDVTAPLSEGHAFGLHLENVETLPGTDVTYDLSPYGYRLIPAGTGLLVQVTVVSALIAEAYNDMLFTDGRALYFATIHDVATEQYKKQYDRTILPLLAKGPWKEAVSDRNRARANYHALCFRMDYAYGYRERWPESFDRYLQDNYPEVRQDLLDGDPIQAMRGLNALIYRCVDDIHTTTGDMPPWFSKLPRKTQNELTRAEGPGRTADREARWEKYTKLRAGKIRGARPSKRLEHLRYYKNMAVITWDEFTMDIDYWESYMPGDPVNVKDTLGFLYRSFEDIKKHPEVSIIVMDLTCNYGGITDGGLYAMGMMKPEFHAELRSSLTGARRTETYRADTNLDGAVDERDGFENLYRFYILISDASFSCGNLLPAIAKEQGAAVIAGLPSAGGGCSIYIMKDLYGTTVGYSGNWAGYTVNPEGEVRSNDEGVIPDIFLDSDIWYDDAKLREALMSGTVANP